MHSNQGEEMSTAHLANS